MNTVAFRAMRKNQLALLRSFPKWFVVLSLARDRFVVSHEAIQMLKNTVRANYLQAFKRHDFRLLHFAASIFAVNSV